MSGRIPDGFSWGEEQRGGGGDGGEGVGEGGGRALVRHLPHHDVTVIVILGAIVH